MTDCDDPGMPGRCGCPDRPTYPPRRPRDLAGAGAALVLVAGLVAAAYGACGLVLAGLVVGVMLWVDRWD